MVMWLCSCLEFGCHRCIFWLCSTAPVGFWVNHSLFTSLLCLLNWILPSLVVLPPYLSSLWVIQPGNYLENVNTVHARLRFQSICYTVIIITVVRDLWFLSNGGCVAGEKEHKYKANYAKDLQGTEWTLDQASKLIEKYTAAESQ